MSEQARNEFSREIFRLVKKIDRKVPTAIDLYSGIGGWTLGLKMAGYKVLDSYEWGEEATETHNQNFNTKLEPIDIRTMDLKKRLPRPGSVDVVVGSPPCTQFSFANRGGSGDIADGLRDVERFLAVVRYLKPKYWVMENVPRVKSILEREFQIGGQLIKYKDLCKQIEVINIADYGLPQSRKRMFAGDFPLDLLQGYKDRCTRRTLGQVIGSLDRNKVKDVIWGIVLRKTEVTDIGHESCLSDEEIRMNRDAKNHHPVYNIMQFPDQLDRPSRTVTATCTRVSRESIVIEDGPGRYRRLSPRERAMLQSFPITYKFFGNSYSARLRMIGNALPPLIAYFLGKAMREIPVARLRQPQEVATQHSPPKSTPKNVKPDDVGRSYPKNRSFRSAIPSLRLHSGTRFELRNHFTDETVSWKVDFYYGNSKDIRSLPLDKVLYKKALRVLDPYSQESIKNALAKHGQRIVSLPSTDLQSSWNHSKKGRGPFELVDDLGELSKEIIDQLQAEEVEVLDDFLKKLLDSGPIPLNGGSKKLTKYAIEVFTGLIVGSWFNSSSARIKPQ